MKKKQEFLDDPLDKLPTLSVDKEKISDAGSARYSIAEWYGKDVISMTPKERRSAAFSATSKSSKKPECPFMATLTPGAKCNKAGGVCTIRKYERSKDGIIRPTIDSCVVTICPARFLGLDSSNKPALAWVAEKMLNITEPIVIKETPFLQTLESEASLSRKERKSNQVDDQLVLIDTKTTDVQALPEEARKAGRIDWLLMDGSSQNLQDPKWCAVETQSVYFSGGKMNPEFLAYSSQPEKIHYPFSFRRPDYRSSGPKRLAPQLSVKVPVLRGWGKKVAVVIDRFFFENMSDLKEAYSLGKSDNEKLDNCEVAWFILDYDEDMNLVHYKYRFSKLDQSIEALNATQPMSKDEFNRSLVELTKNKKKSGKKVFKLHTSKIHNDKELPG